uniref:RNase H type-1 domain-containing protein n=1 Tax=Cannabis sativa TaxID=3483 RepID=A0A803QA02_CANSA
MLPGVAGERYVIFTDASWVKGAAGVAAIGVDRVKGQWFVKAQRTHSNSVLEAELKAILLALNWAVEEGRNEVIILSDSKIAIDALILAERPPEWKSSNIFFDIINVSKKLLVCNFFFISRSLNLLADGMAKSARVAEDQAVLYQGEGVPPVIPIVLSN